MIFLLLAIASSAMVSIVMRISEKYIQNQMGMFMANYALCMMLSLLFMKTSTPFSMSSLTFWMGMISGVLYLASFVYLKMNMKHNGIVMSSTFMKLGVLIPTLMAIVLFHELPKWTQIVGIVLSIIAIIMINYEKDSMQESNKKLWLLVLLVLSGFTDSMANIFDEIANVYEKDIYLLITFFFAFLLAGILTFKEKQKVTLKDILCGILIGIPNYFSARFLLLALGDVLAVLVYPMYSVATIIVITLVGVLCFHETITAKKKNALILILLAMCLLNI